jgi:recombination protein RecA
MNRDQALQSAIQQIEKTFGKGSLLRWGDRGRGHDVETVSTGCISLDWIGLGIGGLPMGRIVEIYGPESSGKTTLTLQTVAQAQKSGGTCAFIDVEHALDPSYAKKLGVQLNDLYISQPDTGEQALEIADTLARSGTMKVIVIDSVAALVPRSELEGDMGEHQVGSQARLMSHALRKLKGSVSNNNCCLIFTNQTRQKIGVMFGNPETTSGGVALKFYASVRMDIRRIGAIKDKDKVIGNQTRIKVVKNKMAAPFREVVFDIMYGEGVSRSSEIIELGLGTGLLEKSGSWYAHKGGEKIGQGKEAVREFLLRHPEKADVLEQKIRQALSSTSNIIDNVIPETSAETDHVETMDKGMADVVESKAS